VTVADLVDEQIARRRRVDVLSSALIAGGAVALVTAAAFVDWRLALALAGLLSVVLGVLLGFGEV
jgi:hypothetical protein